MPQYWLQQKKKQAFFEEKLSETIGNPKELWESFQFLGIPNKTVTSNFNVTEEGNTLAHAVANPDVFWYHLCGMGTQKNLPK